ncbi:ABC transporter substrate-binding protein [Neomegalonema perideroedes]|uniref:ABC transporter substrate-binding protein n=1 Tax=Neomegalonema perideroedes TaxID=217219 RepID=UPI00037B3E20
MKRRGAGFASLLWAGAFLMGAAAAGAHDMPAPAPRSSSPAAAGEAPRRVVSINLCTDQLAMLLAAPGQLISVSMLARDPRSSVMAEEAQALPINHGLAEQVFLLNPDLVLAGTFTSAATVGMLERLGLRVERLAPAYDLEEIAALIRRMGGLLGREAQAEAMAAEFEADLAVLRAGAAESTRPRAALYEANGYAPGEKSLAADLLRTAGFASVAAEFGLDYGGFVPLELLVLAEPDVVIAGRPRAEGAARGEEILVHPALEALRARRGVEVLPDRDWICGLPATLRAAGRLEAARRALEVGK